MPAFLYILPPQLIPGPSATREGLRPELLEGVAELAEHGHWKSNSEAADALALLISRFNCQPDDERQKTLETATSGTKPCHDDTVHDEYFEIRRLGGNAAELYVHMILKANWILFQDTVDSQFSISVDKLNILDRGLGAMLSRALGLKLLEETQYSDIRRVKNWVSEGNGCKSMQRWIRGHQLFAALTQGLISAFRDLRGALERECIAQVADAVDLAVLLLQASGVSLEYTGDFSSDDYNNIIRPSMTPPLVPDTFSGLLSADHRAFVSLLREMKPHLDLLNNLNGDYHQRIAAAVGTVYDSHRFVCDRLVGKSPSLMMANSSKKTGAEQIDQFKHLRLKVFETDHRAATSGAAQKVR